MATSPREQLHRQRAVTIAAQAAAGLLPGGGDVAIYGSLWHFYGIFMAFYGMFLPRDISEIYPYMPSMACLPCTDIPISEYLFTINMGKMWRKHTGMPLHLCIFTIKPRSRPSPETYDFLWS